MSYMIELREDGSIARGQEVVTSGTTRLPGEWLPQARVFGWEFVSNTDSPEFILVHRGRDASFEILKRARASNDEQSSAALASLAARILREDSPAAYTHDEVKSLAASVLTQAPDKASSKSKKVR